MLVSFDSSWRDGSGCIGLVLYRLTYAHMLGEGENESYDPMLVVLTDAGRRTVPVDVVTVVNEKDNDR